MENIKILGSRVLIESIKKEDETQSGIIIATDGEKKKNRGLIVAMGSVSEDVSVGDTVIYEGWGTEVSHEGTDYIMVEEDDLVAIIK